MKRNVLLLVMIVFVSGVSTVFSQTQKGNIMVGGDIANLNVGLSSGSSTVFNLTPKAAWFIQNNLALGAYANLGLSHQKDNGTDFLYGVGALGRYYIADREIEVLKKSQFFLEAHVGIEGADYAGGASTNGLGFGFGPGWTYFITPNVGLEALLTYDGIAGFGSEPFHGGLNLSIGFQIYLSGNQAKKAIQK